MAFSSVLAEADVKAALAGCSGEFASTFRDFPPTLSFRRQAPQNFKRILTGCLRCAFSAADSFEYKAFFKACGLSSKSADEVKKAFLIIDQDNSGFIEEEELK